MLRIAPHADGKSTSSDVAGGVCRKLEAGPRQTFSGDVRRGLPQHSCLPCSADPGYFAADVGGAAARPTSARRWGLRRPRKARTAPHRAMATAIEFGSRRPERSTSRLEFRPGADAAAGSAETTRRSTAGQSRRPSGRQPQLHRWVGHYPGAVTPRPATMIPVHHPCGHRQATRSRAAPCPARLLQTS